MPEALWRYRDLTSHHRQRYRSPARLRADPPSALGPALNDQGYFVGRVERNLYWVTDGTYQSAFLTTRDGVVLFDAPRPSATTSSGPSTRSPPPTA